MDYYNLALTIYKFDNYLFWYINMVIERMLN